jgi:hypothetical protein
MNINRMYLTQESFASPFYKLGMESVSLACTIAAIIDNDCLSMDLGPSSFWNLLNVTSSDVMVWDISSKWVSGEGHIWTGV